LVDSLDQPRSSDFEEVDEVKLPSSHGDNINGDTFDDKSYELDPKECYVHIAKQQCVHIF